MSEGRTGNGQAEPQQASRSLPRRDVTAPEADDAPRRLVLPAAL